VLEVCRKCTFIKIEVSPFGQLAFTDEMAKNFLEAKMKILAIFRTNGRVHRKNAILVSYPINVEF
jgi:hypothetical protein